MDRKFGDTHILTINLESGGSSLDICPKLTEQFVGGRGVNQAILLQKGVDRDKDGIPRRLVIGPGSLVGGDVPCATRTNIDSGNMFNEGIGSGSIGGNIGAYLRFAGYDHLVLEGRARTPKYLFIDKGEVTLLDAGHLWGKTIPETDELLREVHGKDVAILYIGPAGENLVRSACIVSDKYRVQGRCGLGMILGAMRLKAIVIPKNRGKLEVADPDRFKEIVQCVNEKIESQAEMVTALSQSGLASTGGVWLNIASPVKNLQDEYLPPEKQKILSPEAYAKLSTRRSAKGCHLCRIHCDVFMEVPSGPGAGTEWAGVEANVIWDFGTRLDIMDPAGTVYLHILCNQLGLDTDNASSVLSWAFESYHRGVLTKEDTDGLELEWGNLEVAIELLRKMAKREGIGDLLAEGAKRASQKVGKGSEAWAVHVKGQDLAEPLRVAKGWALGCVVSPRGGSHTRGAPPPFCTPPLDDAYAPNSYVGQVVRVLRCERMHALQDSLGLCSIPSQWITESLPGLEDYGQLFGAALGREMTDDDSAKLGEKVMMLEKIFNQIHAGFDRSDDYPPPRMMNEPVSDGPYKGERLSLEDWDKMLDEYYELHGWSKETGKLEEKTVSRILDNINNACLTTV